MIELNCVGVGGKWNCGEGVGNSAMEVNAQVMQALLSTAALLLLVISMRATQLLPAGRESDKIVEVELPGGSLKA